MVFAVGLALSLTLLAASRGEAHRSGCHRWHSCPSDTGSYVCGDLGYFTYCGYSSLPGSEPTSPSRLEVSAPTTPSKPKVTQPAIPRSVVRGVAYLRAGRLNGTMGTVSQLGSGWYQVVVKAARMQVKPGFKTASIWERTRAAKVKRSMKASPLLVGGQLYIPVSALRLLGCGVDTAPLSARYVEVTCGSTTSVFEVRIW